MRIFIVSRGYPSSAYVTNGIFEFDQAKALRMQGHEVVMLCTDLRSIRRKRKFGYENKESDGVNIECISVPCGRIPKKLLRLVRSHALAVLYKKCLKKYGRPDIIHAHFQEIAYTTAQVLGGEGVPLIMTEHLSSLNNAEIDPDLIKTGKNVYNKYHTVIAVGERLRKSLSDNFNISAVVIPNVVDTGSFTLKEQIKKTDTVFRIVSVGSLIKRKKNDVLIRAFSEFRKQYPDSCLEMYGKGVEKDALQELISELKLDSCVVLHGACKRTEIARKMTVSDCFALASDVETFGVVYIEAMAMGLPVIAVKSGGPEEFVDQTTGIVVEKCDVELLTESMIYMRKHIADYDSQHIRNYITSNFSPEVIAHELEKIYSEAIEKSNTCK